MALPWTMPAPESASPLGAFHCPTCYKGTAAAVRAGMHCGYMPRAEWKGEGVPKGVPPHFGGGEPYCADVCPGWLVRQPDVVEAAQAYSARERLDRFDPENLHVVNEVVKLAEKSFNVFEVARQKQLSRKLGS